ATMAVKVYGHDLGAVDRAAPDVAYVVDDIPSERERGEGFVSMQLPTKTSDDQSEGHEARCFRLSLVIPAWHERETIRQAIREAQTALAATVAEYEIIVVDDGSSDGTPEIVRAEAVADPHIRLLQHPHNLGYGSALRTGFQAATLDLVAFTDADC